MFHNDYADYAAERSLQLPILNHDIGQHHIPSEILDAESNLFWNQDITENVMSEQSTTQLSSVRPLPPSDQLQKQKSHKITPPKPSEKFEFVRRSFNYTKRHLKSPPRMEFTGALPSSEGNSPPPVSQGYVSKKTNSTPTSVGRKRRAAGAAAPPSKQRSGKHKKPAAEHRPPPPPPPPPPSTFLTPPNVGGAFSPTPSALPPVLHHQSQYIDPSLIHQYPSPAMPCYDPPEMHYAAQFGRPAYTCSYYPCSFPAPPHLAPYQNDYYPTYAESKKMMPLQPMPSDPSMLLTPLLADSSDSFDRRDNKESRREIRREKSMGGEELESKLIRPLVKRINEMITEHNKSASKQEPKIGLDHVLERLIPILKREIEKSDQWK